MSAGVRIRGFRDVAAFAARAEPWLEEREAEHNLLLGLLPRLISGEHHFEPPLYLAVVEDAGAVAGCAFRTPPHKLCLTRMPADSIEPLVEHVGRVFPSLPAVLGPESEALRFSDLWCRRSGCRGSLAARQSIQVLERVRLAQASAEGRLRRAETGDLPLLQDWMEGFWRDAGPQGGDLATRTRELVADGAIYLWEDGRSRSMAATPGVTRHGVRVGYVYTPPELRRRGHATAAVAALSARLLREGHRYCFLATDLANPTSGAIYARIGYEPVCEVVDVAFSHATDPEGAPLG